MKAARGLGRAALVLTLALGCNERFEFDVPPPEAAAGAGGSPASIGCGDRPACPEGLHCVGGRCLECGVDGDCATGERTRCDPQRNRCVECLGAPDCPSGFACDARANRCLQSCSEDSPCPRTAHGCDDDRGVCYQCDEDYECAGSAAGPRCAVDGSSCAACRTEQDCAGRHCDVLTGKCVECRDGLDCASDLCDPSTLACLPG